MLSGYSLVYFAPGPWDDLWRNRHQLMSVFSRQNKVLYVERRPHLRSTLAALRQGRLKTADIFQPLLRQVDEQLYVFRYPSWAPVCGAFPLRQWTRAIRCALLRSALDRLGFSQPIVWYSQPGMLDLLDAVPAPSLRVYHVVDEYSAYLNHTHRTQERTKERERRMISRVDAVIVVSKNLYQAKRPYNPYTYLVPNAVDYALYQAAQADPALPQEIQRIPKPRLGYTGLVGDKLHLGALLQIARAHPEWSLVFLGQVRLTLQRETWKTLIALPNVHLLEAAPPEQVPHYVKGFQVGMMPYRQNRYTDYIDPLKFYDYMAVGIPVVSTDIPAVRTFNAHIHIAHTPSDLDQAIYAALADNSAERTQARLHLASLNRWEARVEQISGLFEAQLAAKSRSPAWVVAQSGPTR